MAPDMTQEEIDKALAGNAAYIQTKYPRRHLPHRSGQ